MKIGMNQKEKGQVIIVVLLVMVVALAIGLSVVGRSMTEVSTSIISENSTKAFSAAEAGLERAISGGAVGNGSLTVSDFDNQASAAVDWQKGLPTAESLAVEYGKLINKGLNEVAQFWLADPSEASDIPGRFYNSRLMDVYFGDPNGDYEAENVDEIPAVEVKVISWDNTVSAFSEYRVVCDPYDIRRANNSFPDCSSVAIPAPIDTTSGPGRTFYRTLNIDLGYYPDAGHYPILVKARILYSNYSHPVALRPATSQTLPPQLDRFTAKGNSGDTQRTILVIKHYDVMPFFMDYAVFSVGELAK